MSVTDRYADTGVELTVSNTVLDLQLAHRSVRKFLPDPVGEAELSAIVAAAQSAATSSNLQSWSVIAVRDPERKARLARLANNQRFIVQAPLFLIWVADLSRAQRLAERNGTTLAATSYLEATILGFVDAALAAPNAVITAESLGLGTVYVGAIRNHPEDVATEVGLPRHAVATFGLAVGTPDPTEHAAIKPRLPQAAVLHLERYDAQTADADIPAYDRRVERYNTVYGLPGNWSDRVVARLAESPSLHGRDKLRRALEHRGLPSH